MSSLIVEICKIENIFKHPNADKLSIVAIRGWNCIVGLDQYKIGDLVVFCPPDSIIPTDLIEKYGLEYLRKDGRVKTVKLRGYISQGLVFDVPEGNYQEGDDVANILGITKWEPPEPKFYKTGNPVSRKKLNPNLVKYTDIENIQNYPNIFKDYDFVVITEKCHGSNARYGNLEIVINNKQPLLEKCKNWFQKNILQQTHQFVYGSHNIQMGTSISGKSFYGDDIWGKIAKKYDLASKIPKDWIIFGEIYGKGIQDLTYGLIDVRLIIFDIRDKRGFLSWDQVKDFCIKNELQYVPEIYVGQWNKDLLVQFTIGESLICKNNYEQMREGCVIKMFQDENHPQIGRKILKSINKEYLLRKNGTEYK